MKILGLSAFYHDSAAALVVDGELVAAAQEERFTRKKHDSGFPINAAHFCLESAGLSPAEVDHVAFYDKPFLKFERLLETYLTFAPRGFQSFRHALPVWIKEKLFQKDLIAKEIGAQFGKEIDWTSRLLFSEHHLSHAASAFFPSPVRSRGRADDGRCRRVDHDVPCDRQRQRPQGGAGDPLPPFTGPAVLGIHLLHRVQGQLG